MTYVLIGLGIVAIGLIAYFGFIKADPSKPVAPPNSGPNNGPPNSSPPKIPPEGRN